MPTAAARRALVSVSDKSELGPFARALVEIGFEIVSTGGTRRFLLEQNLPVTDITEYTGFPEMMEGRVKTLHPKVHGGLLGRPDLPDDARAMKEHGILPFELVVCNLYPFEATIARPGASVAEAIENIDIGGPSMIRSAAKNHAHVAVVTHAAQYPAVLEALKTGPLPAEMRRRLVAPEPGSEAGFPEKLSLSLTRLLELRYGENPHQKGALYVASPSAAGTLAAARQIHGKELSYNNLLDLDAAMSLVREFAQPAAVVIKHNNPCGAAISTSLVEAFEKAWAGDPVSAFGSILAFNRPVDAAVAEKLCQPDRFVEAMIAPDYAQGALEILTTRPKWKGSVRLMQCSEMLSHRPPGIELRHVSGGLLAQSGDDQPDPETEWKVVTSRAPTAGEQADLRFAWSVCRHVKSNAIVFARDGCAVGVGAGQMSRVDSVMIAAHKSQSRSAGAVMASDAFFPFRDGLDQAARAGITAVIQPGGSRNDAEAVAACNEQNLAMIFTGRRHFRH
jgi:phosphoribosylaminoimidazolecarboxamide formyltransferase/IMP cyclohydrolase